MVVLAFVLLILDLSGNFTVVEYNSSIFSTGVSVERKKHNKLAEGVRIDTVQKRPVVFHNRNQCLFRTAYA